MDGCFGGKKSLSYDNIIVDYGRSWKSNNFENVKMDWIFAQKIQFCQCGSFTLGYGSLEPALRQTCEVLHHWNKDQEVLRSKSPKILGVLIFWKTCHALIKQSTQKRVRERNNMDWPKLRQKEETRRADSKRNKNKSSTQAILVWFSKFNPNKQYPC